MKNIESHIFRVSLFLPFIYWAYLLFSGSLGADPAKTLNHKLGEFAFYCLILNLLIGVLISFSFRFPKWMRFLVRNRRFLGIVTFFYLIFHFVLYLIMESFGPQAFEQLVTKRYLVMGLAAWLILLVLTLTSNDFSMRRLGGKKWKNIHRLVYLATAFITIHVLSIEKADLIKFGTILALLWAVQIFRFAYLKLKKA
ncbi:MAG: sulfite oxidase heme-binding subunit YedZ [Pseudobdellovibrionaceae bacterium]